MCNVVCKFFSNFKKCKFTNCAFKHNKRSDTDGMAEKIKILETKLGEVQNDENAKEIEQKLLLFEKKYEGKTEALEKEFLSKFEALGKEHLAQMKELEKKYAAKIEVIEDKLKKKIDAFENLLEKQKDVINEKDLLISTLENRVKVNEKALEKAVKKSETDQQQPPSKEQFSCNMCDFKTNSKQGLNVHIKRKHTTYSEETLPTNCEICDEKFTDYKNKSWSKVEIEKHITSHSYQSSSELKFKCNECEFWGPNRLTMELHMKKFHSEKITCGLCNYEAKTIEELETHNLTCENFRCCECDNNFKNILDIKDHTVKEHKGKHIWISHSRSDRNHPDFFMTQDHSNKELFRKNK